MFDIIKAIIWGFSGKFSDHPQARKSVWILLITGFFSLCCLFFAAYVSFSRYVDLTGFLPGAGKVAFAFTLGVAGYIFFASSYISTFAAEKWMLKKSNLNGGIATALFLSAIVVGLGDYQMNLDGAADVANAAAGQIHQMDDASIRAKYTDDIKDAQGKLDALLAGQLGGYGWQDKKGVYHLNNSGKRFQRALTSQIDKLRTDMSSEIQAERQRIDQMNGERSDRKTITHERLLIAVRAVYFIQFALCLVMALLGVSMAQAMGISSPAEEEEDESTQSQDEETEPKPTSNFKEINGKENNLGFEQGHHKLQKSGVDPQMLDKLVRDKIYVILGSMSGPKDKEYLYRYFNADDAEASRKRKKKKADSVAEKARQLKMSGVGVAEIAEKVGRSERQVRRYLNEN